MSNYIDDFEHQRELYCTPPHITKALLRRELFPGRIWEPAAGRGDIVRVLHACGYSDVVASDLYDWGSKYDQVDFLASETQVDCLITNPPYSLMPEFLTHAKRVVTYKFAMLLPILVELTKKWMDRHEHDGVFALKACYVFPRAIPWTNVRSLWGKKTHAWFVFERGFRGQVIREKILFRRNSTRGGVAAADGDDEC